MIGNPEVLDSQSASGMTVWIARLSYLILFSSLIVIFFSDLKYQIIPDEVQIALFGLIFVEKLLYGSMAILFGLFGGVVVAAPILLIYLATRGRAMGFGDVKLSFIIGFLLGIKGGYVALYIAFVIGALIGLLMIFLGRKKLKSKIAFGPFLVIGTVTVLIFQNEINKLINYWWRI
ncbi:prepilin peptidase [Candidatus Roizmanbacteria bacterium]|nr:prepilin peptidase [Candidatus Roizmanbacteria bacterium]